MLGRVLAAVLMLSFASCAKALETGTGPLTDEPSGSGSGSGAGSGSGSGGGSTGSGGSGASSASSSGSGGSAPQCDPDAEAADTCMVAKKAGMVSDDNDVPVLLEGTLTTPTDVDWFTFDAIDKPEGVGNSFHVEIVFATPTEEVVFDVIRACGMQVPDSSNIKAYTFCVDGKATTPDGGVIGEAECGLVDPATDPCVDQTSTFFVRVHAAEDYSGGGDCGKYEIKVTGRGGSPCDFTSTCEPP